MTHRSPLALTRMLVLVWMVAAGGMWLIRARVHWPAYVRGHAWLDGMGVARWARNLDSDIALIGLGLLIWGLVRLRGARVGGTEGGPVADFGLGMGGLVRGVGIGSLIGLPMLLIGIVYAAVHGVWPSPAWEMIVGVVAAPLNEEFFYRGVLVFVLWRFGLGRFWTLAVVASLMFGLGHIRWTVDGLASGWATVLVTGGGGVWYAWLASRWGSRLPGVRSANLWVVFTLHGLMNGAWLLFDSGDGAVGGVWPNIARGATIALSVALTMRLCPRD